MKDAVSIGRIEQLHPTVRNLFTNFITECENTFGIILRITLPVYRTIAEQNKLYAQGRTEPGNIVTNAPGGTSFHNFGLAVDLCELTPDGSQVNWAYDMSKLLPIATKYGIEWGGEWTHIKDRPHFEFRNGHKENCADLMAMVNAGQVDENGYVILNAA